MNYYEISEETARTAHSMVHMSDYKPGSATDGYRAAVDEAAALVASKRFLRSSLPPIKKRWMMQRPPTPFIARTKRWMAAPASPRKKKRGLPAPAYSPKATERPLRFMAAHSRLMSCRAAGATSSASPTVWLSWTSGRRSRPSPPKTRSSTAARSSATWRPTGSKSSSTRSPTRRPATSLNPTASAGRLAMVHGNASSPEMLSTRLAAS